MLVNVNPCWSSKGGGLYGRCLSKSRQLCSSNKITQKKRNSAKEEKNYLLNPNEWAHLWRPRRGGPQTLAPPEAAAWPPPLLFVATAARRVVHLKNDAADAVTANCDRKLWLRLHWPFSAAPTHLPQLLLELLLMGAETVTAALKEIYANFKSIYGLKIYIMWAPFHT